MQGVMQERREKRRGKEEKRREEEMLMDSAGQLGSRGLHSVVLVVFYHETSARYDQVNYLGWLFYWRSEYSL